MTQLSQDDQNIYLNPALIFALLPARLPGKIVKIVRRVDQEFGFIELLIPALYPDGSRIEPVYCRDLTDFDEGVEVMFSWRAASSKAKRDKNQPDLIEAFDVSGELWETINTAIGDYHNIVATEVQEQLRDILEEVQEIRSQQERTLADRVAAAVAARIEELDRKEGSLDARVESLEERERQLDEAIRLQVASLLAERSQTLDRKEAKLAALEMELKERGSRVRNSEDELTAREKALAAAQIQFEREGGKVYIEFLNSVSDKAQQKKDPLHGRMQAFDPDQIHRSLAQRGYRTSPEMIRRTVVAALAAWSSGQFVILSGPTGVGKTQLVRQFAQIIGAGHGIVAVRPAWVDPSDLLGYYNPMQKLFEPTPFLDNVLEAHSWAEANRLFAICLDEMNLSRVENYAADLLSRVERVGAGDEVYLDLYSRDVAARMVQEQRELLGSVDSLSPESRAYLHAITRQIVRYQGNGRLRMPGNLAMFGTVNVDETTQLFSPKFLDRAYVIRFEPVAFSSKLTTTPYTGQEFDPTWPLPLDGAMEIANSDVLPEESQSIWRDFVGWQSKYFASFGLHFGHRFYSSFRRYMSIGHSLGISNLGHLGDDFFQAKIPPRIRFDLEESAVGDTDVIKADKLTQWMDSLGNNYPGLHDVLDGMIKRSRGRGMIEFWD